MERPSAWPITVARGIPPASTVTAPLARLMAPIGSKTTTGYRERTGAFSKPCDRPRSGLALGLRGSSTRRAQRGGDLYRSRRRLLLEPGSNLGKEARPFQIFRRTRQNSPRIRKLHLKNRDWSVRPSGRRPLDCDFARRRIVRFGVACRMIFGSDCERGDFWSGLPAGSVSDGVACGEAAATR